MVDDIEIVEPEFAGQYQASAAYLVAGGENQLEVIFSKELGLAIERPPNNLTIEQLWRVI